MSTTIPGGGASSGHHGFHLYGGAVDQVPRGAVGAGFTGHGPRSIGDGGWGTHHGHLGSANGASGDHRNTDRGNGQSHGERLGGTNANGFGHDTINLGSGHDTLVAAGVHVGYHIGSHSATMVGGAHHTSFIGGQSLIAHGSASDTHTGGAAMVHGSTNHMTTLIADHKVGTDVIKNFVTGHDKLYLESHALSYLHSNVNVTMSHGSTHIALDGGHTTIALKGFSHFDTGGHK
jgi:hypothetical protein